MIRSLQTVGISILSITDVVVEIEVEPLYDTILHITE